MPKHEPTPTSADIAVIRGHVQRIDRRLAGAEEAISNGDTHDAVNLMSDARVNLRMLAETRAGLASVLEARELIDSATHPGSGFHLARALNGGGY